MPLPMSWAERSGTVALCLWFSTAGAWVTVGGAVSVVWLEEADRLEVSFSCATTLGFSSVHDVVSLAAVGKGRTQVILWGVVILWGEASPVGRRP